MNRRGIYFVGILLFCALVVSCGRADNPTEENDEAGQANPKGGQTDSLFTGTDSIDIHIYESGEDLTQKAAQGNDIQEENKDAADADTEDKAVMSEYYLDGQEGMNVAENQEQSAWQQGKDRKENQERSTWQQGKSQKGNPELGIQKDDGLKEKDTMSEAAQKTVRIAGLLKAESDAGKFKDKMDLYPAGTVIETGGAGKKDIAVLFYSEKISNEVRTRITGKSYGDSCTVPLDELRYIRVLYKGFDGLTHIGELIVNKGIAKDITDIFKELYETDYPIDRMVLVDEYGADDIVSMEADNTSAFNFRVIDRTTELSNHSYGLAVDINPLYNPFVRTIDGKTLVLPEGGQEYADRNKDCPYYIKEGDPCYQAFTKRGFTWGGDWKSRKDYQHFEKE